VPIDRSGVGDTAAAFVQTRGRISEPSAAPFRRRHRALARPAAPPYLGSSA
jgi:hypothetical protein